MNKFDEMRAAVADARGTKRAADPVAKDPGANDMAFMLRGRLRDVNPWHLVELKRELTEFNANTRTWKS